MILAPVGAGKTAITLTAMDEMLRDGHVKRWLVVAPTSASARMCGRSKHRNGLASLRRWRSARQREGWML